MALNLMLELGSLISTFHVELKGECILVHLIVHLLFGLKRNEIQLSSSERLLDQAPFSSF